MDCATLGGAARAMAAVATVVAALATATAPAAAADGPPAGAAGAVAPPTDVAGVHDLATALVQQAAQDAPAASELVATLEADVGPPVALEAAQAAETGQYQPQEPQYREETGQYQEPPTAPHAPAALGPGPSGSLHARPDAPVGPVNINVSVRLLSPGSDGPVNQASSPLPQPVNADPAPQPAITSGDDAANVAVSVTVNVRMNWNIIWHSVDADPRYQPSEKQYHNSHEIDALISGSTGSQIPTEIGAATGPGLESLDAREAPAPDRWAAAASLRPGLGVERQPKTPGRGRRGATLSSRNSDRGPITTAPVIAARSPLTAWARAPQPVRRSTPRGESAPAARSVPARPPSVPGPSAPEPFAGAAASGGAAFANFFKTLAVLVVSLGLAALRPARRLRLPSKRLQEAYGPRPEKPG
jgi:hypothetical protein